VTISNFGWSIKEVHINLGERPDSSFGPKPALRVSLTPPTLGDVKLRKTRLRGTKGTEMRASISQDGFLDAEYYRLDSKATANNTSRPVTRGFTILA
jgi:hypothetical protein